MRRSARTKIRGIQGLLLFQASTGFICTMRKIRESKSGKEFRTVTLTEIKQDQL
jgi:hypothetical protein